MRVIALVVVMSLASSSCSLIGTETPPPATTWKTRSTCNSGYLRPGADTAIAGVGALAAFGGGVTAANTTDKSGYGVLAGGVVVAGVFLTSAILGFGRVGACRDALAEWDKDPAHALVTGPNALEASARVALQCPQGPIAVADMDARAAWAQQQLLGCDRITWCGTLDNGLIRCGNPEDLDFALSQLSVETACPKESIHQLQFFGLNTQNTYRLDACGRQYSCLVPLVHIDGETAAGSRFGSQITCKPVPTQAQPPAPVPSAQGGSNEPPPPPPPPPAP